MNTFLFNPDYMAKYYNCSGRTYDEWKALGNPNIVVGIIYAVPGFIYWTVLIPFLIVFAKSDFMQYSCYKIMFVLGLIDCLELPVAGFYCGYGAAVGMVYCMAPTMNYICGCILMACWCGGSMACVLLALNRCIDLINPQLGKNLFAGKKTVIWLMLPIAYFSYIFFFHAPTVFNSSIHALFSDPFVGTPERHGLLDDEHYPYIFHSIHNTVLVIVLPALYASLFIHLSVKAAQSHNRIKMSKIQRQTFLQCTLICITTFIGAGIYVCLQFFPTPIWIIVFGHTAWQLSHGAAGISYAFLNPTMRKELVKVFRPKTNVVPSTGAWSTVKPTVSEYPQSTTMNY